MKRPASAVLAPLNVAGLRAQIAGVGCPDEGMRGSSADVVRQHLVQQKDTVMNLADVLRSGSDQEVADTAAIIRSCLLGPAEGEAVCSIVAEPLCAAFERTCPSTMYWVLAATLRLAQFQEIHRILLNAGVVERLKAAWVSLELGCFAGKQCTVGPRYDILTCHILAFLSETAGSEVATLVPLDVVGHFEQALQTRLSIAHEFSRAGEDTIGAEAAQLVKVRAFYGFPFYYRSRFVLQALAGLALSSEKHARIMWKTCIPDLLCKIILGSLPNDPGDNTPYGSPDAMEMSVCLAHAMLPHASESCKSHQDNLLAALANLG